MLLQGVYHLEKYTVTWNFLRLKITWKAPGKIIPIKKMSIHAVRMKGTQILSEIELETGSSKL